MDSPGIQTLAALKQEAVAERQQRGKSSKGRGAGQVSRSSSSRRKTSRPCKVMKEAYFRGMEWTRSFVSGPVDPRWYEYKIYCQICKASISIYSKGAREILRHYATEKHQRNDQQWRCEYLYKIDPITKSRIPQVRGKDGKLLTHSNWPSSYQNSKMQSWSTLERNSRSTTSTWQSDAMVTSMFCAVSGETLVSS